MVYSTIIQIKYVYVTLGYFVNEIKDKIIPSMVYPEQCSKLSSTS